MRKRKKYIYRALLFFMLAAVWTGAGGSFRFLNLSSVEVYADTKPKNQFVKKNGKWYYYDNNGKLVKGWFTSKGGNKYHFEKDGSATTGLSSIGGKKYLFNAKGKMLTKWQKINGKTYYFDESAGNMLTGWVTTKSGNKYYFGTDGAVKSGWQKVGGKYYYFSSKGKMEKNCFKNNGSSTYYLKSDGTMAKGRKKIGKYWYSFNRNSGKLVKKGWYKETDGTYYYAASDGKLVSGFYKPDSYYRYFRPSDCRMLTGWQDIDGKRYYFKKSNGIRYDNIKLTASSGNMYYFSKNGVLYQKKWFTKSGATYYAQSNGVLATGWLTLSGNKYYLDTKTGARVTGWITIGTEEYYLKPSTGILAVSQWVDDDHYVGENGALIPGYSNQSFRWPLSSSFTSIVSYFGHRESPGGIGSTNHQGIDISAPTGTPIYAADDGTIVLMQKTSQSNGAGNYTQINHGKGIITEYMHQSEFNTELKVGDKVKKGDLIGYVGTTGNVTGAHLHFGVIVNGVKRDPLNYVKVPS